MGKEPPFKERFPPGSLLHTLCLVCEEIDLALKAHDGQRVRDLAIAAGKLAEAAEAVDSVPTNDVNIDKIGDYQVD